jgi:hypothetical protein
MHWQELEKEINRLAEADAGFRDDSYYFQALANLNWDQAGRDIFRNIEVMCEFLNHYRPRDERIDIDQEKLQGVWLETVEPLADCVENVYLERHGMLKAEDKKEFGVQCVGQAIQKMYDELAGVPNVGYIDMGLDSDLARVKETFKNARRALVYKPTDLVNKSLETIQTDLEKIAREYAPCDVVVGDIDDGMPDERVLAFLELCGHINSKMENR